MVSSAEAIIYSWFERSGISYADAYARLYIAYNAWFSKVTGKGNSHEAIRLLKTRFVIWEEYEKGIVCVDMRPVVERIVQLLRSDASLTIPRWNVSLSNANDWANLIQFWYEVRCRLFHGKLLESRDEEAVRLAHESLYVFMSEIVSRMKRSFKATDYVRLEELRILSVADSKHQADHVRESIALHQKYIDAPALWQVDMQRRQT